MTLPLNDLLRVLLPNRGARGMVVMLEFYFDDSGTHGDSRVVVWGGIAGHKQFVDELDAAWRKQLLEPCEGKPRTGAFSSADLASGWGEFRGYTQAERDRTRHNFRKLILDAQMSLLSFGASVRDYETVMSGRPRSILGTAERMVFAVAVRAGCEAAKKFGEPATFLFDAGRHPPDFDSAVQVALDGSREEGLTVSHGYAQVEKVPALQAADLVAHETYQYLTRYIDDPNAQPTPHLKSLFRGAFDANIGWYGRANIQDIADDIRRLVAKIDSSASGE